MPAHLGESPGGSSSPSTCGILKNNCETPRLHRDLADLDYHRRGNGSIVLWFRPQSNRKPIRGLLHQRIRHGANDHK